MISPETCAVRLDIHALVLLSGHSAVFNSKTVFDNWSACKISEIRNFKREFCTITYNMRSFRAFFNIVKQFEHITKFYISYS